MSNEIKNDKQSDGAELSLDDLEKVSGGAAGGAASVTEMAAGSLASIADASEMAAGGAASITTPDTATQLSGGGRGKLAGRRGRSEASAPPG